jgi:S1-C subfamily serine protease
MTQEVQIMKNFSFLSIASFAAAALVFAGAITISPSGSKAQESSGCFMIDKSGRTINLNYLCGDNLTATPLITRRASPNPLPLTKIAEQSLKAVVQLESTQPSPTNLSTTITTTGSRFFISDSGLLLTNAHIVGDNPVVQARFSKKLTLPARVIRKSSQADLALLKINVGELNRLSESMRPTVLPICYSDEVDIGEQIVVIGNPRGMRNSVTQGVISGIRNSKEDEISWFEADIDLLQIDAAINPGNSGGPLIDRYGSAVGIVTAKRIFSEGMSLAIPMREAVSRFNLNLPDACSVRIVKPKSTD